MKARLKAILPHMPIVNAAQVLAAVKAEMSQIGREVKSDFDKTTAGWETKVEFTVDVGLGIVTVSTDSAIYGFVNSGTKPHVILPRRTKVMRFQGRRGLAYARSVDHPGTKGKFHSRRIAAQWRGRLQSRLQAAIASAVAR